MKTSSTYFIVGVLLLIACSAQSVATPLLTKDPSPTFSQHLFTITIPPSSPTPEIVSTPTFMLNSSHDVFDALQKSCGAKYRNNNPLNRILSPNKQWIAIVCDNEELYTEVYRVDGYSEWKFSPVSSDFADWYFHPYHWTTDEKSLYLTVSVDASLDCPECFYVEGHGLYKLDLFSGKLETIFEPSINGYNYAFSPNDRYFVFVGPQSENDVIIKDFNLGVEDKLTFKTKYVDLGRFVWTKDSSKLVILAGIGGQPEGISGYSLFLYDLNSKSTKILIDNDARKISPATGYDYEERIGSPWITNETLLLGDPLFGGDAWTINIHTGILLPYLYPLVTPTYNP